MENHIEIKRKIINLNHLKHIENLVFQGGEVKGVAYIGALEVLLDEKSASHLTLRQIKRVAGAITALLLALGNKFNELSKLVTQMDLKDDLLDIGDTNDGWTTRDTVIKLIELLELSIEPSSLTFYKSKHVYSLFVKIIIDIYCCHLTNKQSFSKADEVFCLRKNIFLTQKAAVNSNH